MSKNRINPSDFNIYSSKFSQSSLYNLADFNKEKVEVSVTLSKT